MLRRLDRGRATIGLLMSLGIAVAAAACDGGTTSTAVKAAGAAALPSSQGSSAPGVVESPAVPVSRQVAKPASVPATSRGATLLAAGVVLPNRSLTPGATNAAVTQSTIAATICRTGYTKTIRPSSTYTTTLKRQQLAAGYAYRGDVNISDYEEDHLISLELGGAPRSVRNLWPEPYRAAEGARVKDKVENRLHDLVCSGRLPLRVAQRAIATNWWSAYRQYGGQGLPTVYLGTFASGTTAASSGAGGATAQCRDGSYSYSQHRSGTCSHHGGVDRWINPPPS